jgi:UPF0755 protein
VSRRPRPRKRSTGRAPKRRRSSPRILKRIVLIASAVAALAAAWVAWAYLAPGPKAKAGGSTVVILQRGSGVAQIAGTLEKARVIRSGPVFLAFAKLSGRSLKAGEYEFASRAPMARVLSDIGHGKVVRHFITIPEGWTSAMAAQAVSRAPELTGSAEVPPEGTLFPETYQVERGDDRAGVLQRMARAQETLLAELWAKRQPGLPFNTPQEAVTLASIVEKETALPAERGRIAAVFVNRLRTGMRLESDPTVIYGISQGWPLGRGLTVAELAEPTAYNTYRIAGLPPTPIGNPGRESLAAVLNPPRSDELFFVATGQGGHVFASSYEAHQQNVAKWREVERQRAAQAAGTAAGAGK